MAQLTCRDLTLGYEGNPVIEHLSFSVNAGDYLYIVGENGSGKSTLMKALLRLKSPMAGTIETGDGLQADEIGYLPQQTAVQRRCVGVLTDCPHQVLVFDEFDAAQTVLVDTFGLYLRLQGVEMQNGFSDHVTPPRFL